MIVDFARQRVEAGSQPRRLYMTRRMDRFRPILMTTLAAVFGRCPLLWLRGRCLLAGLSVWSSGRFGSSQFITLYITPVIYLYLEQFQEMCWIALPFPVASSKKPRSGETKHTPESYRPILRPEIKGYSSVKVTDRLKQRYIAHVFLTSRPGTSRFIEIEGARLHVVMKGSGQPVV